MLPKRGFKASKCKTALNLAKSRIKLMKNKKENQLKLLKREVAHLLESGQDQTARIRVEHVIREEKMMAAYEMIEIYCELVVVRLPIIESQKNCPLDLKEAIASLIFAAPRCGDITELQDVRKHFTAKYGKEFANAAAEVRPECGVSRTLVEKLSVNAPDGQMKVKVLTAIAEEHNIKWEPNWFKDDPVPSVDLPKVAVAQFVEDSKIQMQPLNFEIADDLEENHAHDKAKPGTSQSHAHTNSDLLPPSSNYRPNSRPSESSSEKMKYNQSSGDAESAFAAGRQQWNMGFKDATAAAQAAAESAELASLAARAAAELSKRSNIMSEDNRHNVGSGLQHNHVHRNSINDSINQWSPRMQNLTDTSRQGNMTEGGDTTNVNEDYTQYGVQYETGKQDDTDSKNSRRHTSDSNSSPIASKAEPNMFRSSNFQEYDNESSENPFYEETLENKSQSNSFQSKSSAFEDKYGVFSNLNYDSYKDDSGDGSFGSFSRKIADQEDWHVRSAKAFGEEDTTFKELRGGNRNLESDNKYGYDSGSDVFAGMDHRTGGMDVDDKGINSMAEVCFDESDSDDDDKGLLHFAEEHNFPSSAKPTQMSSFNHYEPDFSESFRRSPIYTKLNEPIPVTFDDSDGASSGSEKELQRENFEPKVVSYDNQKPDGDPHRELLSSYVEKGTADSFMGSKHVEENQSRYSGSVSENKNGFDESDVSQSFDETSSAAVSTDFKSRSDYDLLDEGGPQKSLQSLRLSESQHPVSKFGYETQSSAEGGMELNLGSLTGGRRNRAHGRMPRGRLAEASSPPRSTEAARSNTFGSSEKASTSEFQASSSQIDNKRVPYMSGLQAHYDSPSVDTKFVNVRKDSDNAEGPYKVTLDENLSSNKPKNPARFFDTDDSSSEEDVPKPVAGRTYLGAGLSRRTKASAPISVASSRTSVAAAKGQSSSPYNTEVSSSRIIDQSSWNDEATYGQSLATKASKNDRSSSVPEKPPSPKSSNVEASSSNEKAPSRENSSKNPSHVHPKLPDFELITAHLQSLRKNRP